MSALHESLKFHFAHAWSDIKALVEEVEHQPPEVELGFY